MEDILTLADNVSSELSCDVLVLNTPMSRSAYDRVEQELEKHKSNKKENLLYLITTNGGDPNAAYRISRTFQRHYKHTHACVAGWCKSAGTLCTIGASSLYMSDRGELGPLDMQIQKQDEIIGMDSGLIVSNAFDALQGKAYDFFESFMLKILTRGGSIRFKTATDIASLITKGAFEPIFSQIDPNKVGEMARYLAIAEAYGERLNSHENAHNLREESLQHLTRGYPSHGFTIDREEASRLFENVSKPSDALQKLIDCLGVYASTPDPSDKSKIFFLKKSTEQVEEQDNGAPENNES
ncbi:MAG: hypothetical protein RR808_08410 [Akkermansia sp.]